jgi:CheY-like chemotaxis protein
MTEREGCVLVVDDERDIRDTLCEVVEMGGCTAITASNGAEAMRLIVERRPCLVILDLLMPVMTGNEFLEAIRGQPGLADVPILISTSAPDRAPQGFPVLPKPVDMFKLWEWMKQSCTCGRSAPSNESLPRGDDPTGPL